MTIFNTEHQEFNENTFPVLLKDSEWKLFLSKEMSDLYYSVWFEAEKILEWALWHDSSAFEKTDFIPEDKDNCDYNFVVWNPEFTIENNKIILDILVK